jgi:PAS domain S-box-containing protein
MGGRVDLDQVSLDMARYAQPDMEEAFVEFLRQRLAKWRPDLVVPIGAPAGRFVVKFRDRLFPGTPVIYTGMDRRTVPPDAITRNATFVGEDFKLAGLVEDILQLAPDTTNIEVILGATPLERYWAIEFRRAFEPFTNRVRFNFLNDLSFEQMLGRLSKLPPRSFILLGLLLRDASGVTHNEDEALQRLRAVANAPINGLYQNQMGLGIVGGRLHQGELQGVESARIAVRVLGGEPVSSFPPMFVGTQRPRYDWRELQRWNISEDRLPSGSVIEFRQPTVWKRYQRWIIGALALICLQAAMIVALIVQRRRRRRIQAVLQESQQLMELATGAGELGLWSRDLTKGDVWGNGPMRSLFGFDSTKPLRFDDMLARVHPDDQARTRAEIARSEAAGQPFQEEFRTVLPGGTERWVLAKGRTVEPRNGGSRRMGVVLDISERKWSEQRLRESEERFRVMADAAPVMIWMSGADKLCTFFNKGWLDFTGRTLEHELGNGWTEGVHKDDLDRRLEIYVNAVDARQEFAMEYRLRRCDGEYRWVLDHGVPRVEPDGTFLGYIGSTIDITERKRGAEALEKERAFLRQVIDIDPNFIFAKDRDGRFTLANQAVADAYGTTVENLIGRTDADFNPNREEVELFRRMDLEVMDTLQERFIPEEHVTDARGNRRWVQTVKRPIIESDGSARQVLGASTDITRRKETEIQLLEQRAELAHVARISTMGELAASLAHELNQPLTAILSNAQAALRFLSSKPADLEEVREILQDIVKDNSRAGEVIRRMRALVKKEEQLDFATLDLANLIRDVVALLHSDAILQNVRIAGQLNDDLLLVRGDRVQLQQVLLNILLNAFDAMKERPAREREVKLRAERQYMGMILVAVSDRGIGLGGDKLDKIFEPFYTTKGEGLGMGLSICRSIIEAHGGRLWAENNPDRGATFYFTVPVEKGVEGRVSRVTEQR